MRKLAVFAIFILLVSCKPGKQQEGSDIISVSIPPFSYFVEKIAGSDFTVNVMVPPSADPHVYEPAPGQISALVNSSAYISDGHLAFEMTWLERFYETNPSMKKLNLADNIDLIFSEEEHGSMHHHEEGADPHFWVSPKSAIRIAAEVKSLLCSLKPDSCTKYETRYAVLADTIIMLDKKADSLLGRFRGRSFMIFHPSLGYLARDYGIRQVAVESEGKEPNPASMREFINIGAAENVKVILIQAGFDTKNAEAIASEIGAEVKFIDPLGKNWLKNADDIIETIHDSFLKGGK